MEKGYVWASLTYYSSTTIVATGLQKHWRLLYKYWKYIRKKYHALGIYL